MSESTINRRGLLGLMAAAPVAAVAPNAAPMSPSRVTTLSVSVDSTAMRESVREMIDQINAAVADNYPINGLHSGGMYPAPGEAVEIWTPLRPPEGSGHADGRPDARRDPSEDCPPAAVRSPAVASGQSFESDILKLARAC